MITSCGHRLFAKRQERQGRVLLFPEPSARPLHSERVGAGLQGLSEKDIVLHVNDSLTIDAQLRVGAKTETIEVRRHLETRSSSPMRN